MYKVKQNRLRVNFITRVAVTTRNNTVFITQLKNIGLGGALLEGYELAIGEKCALTIQIKNRKIKISAKVIRQNKHGLAMIFEEMDHNSFFGLKDLINSNCKNKERFKSECSSRCGFK